MLELSVERLVWGISPTTEIQEEIMCDCFFPQQYVVSGGWEHIVTPGIRFLQGLGQSKEKNSNGEKKPVVSSTLSMSHRARCYEQFSQSLKAPVLKKTNHWAVKEVDVQWKTAWCVTEVAASVKHRWLNVPVGPSCFVLAAVNLQAQALLYTSTLCSAMLLTERWFCSITVLELHPYSWGIPTFQSLLPLRFNWF